MTRPFDSQIRQAGFALLAVLWITVGVAALAMTATLVAEGFISAARNRIALEKAAWHAEDCLERGLSAIANLLVQEEASWSGPLAGRSNAQDPSIPGFSEPPEPFCELEIRAAGAALDINSVDELILRRVLAAAAIPPGQSDSLVAALLDWLDPDDVPRHLGAERADYEARGMPPPRNGPLADLREVRRVRGWESLDALDPLFSVDEGRIAFNHASLQVLAVLPGITPEVIQRIASLRRGGETVQDLLVLSSELSPSAGDSLTLYYNVLTRITTVHPDAWILTSWGNAGTPVVRVAVEVRLVLTGGRAAVVRRRTWVA